MLIVEVNIQITIRIIKVKLWVIFEIANFWEINYNYWNIIFNYFSLTLNEISWDFNDFPWLKKFPDISNFPGSVATMYNVLNGLPSIFSVFSTSKCVCDKCFQGVFDLIHLPRRKFHVQYHIIISAISRFQIFGISKGFGKLFKSNSEMFSFWSKMIIQIKI